MSRVIITFRVMPTGTEIDLNKLEQEIKTKINPQRIEREPIAFGLVALNVTVLIEDKEGLLEATESKLREISDVSEVEVTEITRSI